MTMNLVELLYESVTVHGTQECIRYKQDGAYTSLTYLAFWDHVKRLAAGLTQRNVKFGDKVAILSNNCPEWAMSDYALLLIGAVVVPIYPSIPAEQVAYILKNADVSTVIVQDKEQLKKVLGVWPESLRKVIVISPDDAYFDLIATTHDVSRFSDVMVPQSPSDEEISNFRIIPDTHLATIVHTSGTSGNPKGVMLSHGNIVSNVQASLSMLPVQPDDISLSYLPLSHIFERTVGQFAAFSAGSAVAYAESIETIPANLLEVRPTILVTVPRLLEKVYAQILSKVETSPKPIRRILASGMKPTATGFPYRLVDMLVYRKLRNGLGGRMRAVVSGGAALSANIGEFYQRAGIPVHEGYGMTEASPVITVNPLGANRPGTVGQVIPGAEIKIAEDGELLVKGASVMHGYYASPEETTKALEGGWLHTGDIAEIYDGYVKIVDRKKNIMVLATGKNVAPGPVENAIALSPYISSAVLVGDGRKYVACVLAPDVESLRPLATNLQLGDGVDEWIAHPEIRSVIAAEVRRNTAEFASFEQPKRAFLLAHELTLESGDLTPTLKVKTRILMEKYGQQIEDMYNGVNFLPIDLTMPDETVHPTLTPGPTSQGTTVEGSQPPRRRRRYLRWVAAATVALLLVGVGTVFASGARLPKNLNILGMVQHIRSNNDKINQENGQIVGNLQGISQLATTTSTIASNLHTLKDGIVQDGTSLQNLNQLSQQEIDLSQSFYTLGQTLQTDLGGIAHAANAENNSVHTMVEKAAELNRVASNLATVNQSVANKLSTADSKARTIAAEMP
jgi:long-chain acyl-CoA synthetase